MALADASQTEKGETPAPRGADAVLRGLRVFLAEDDLDSLGLVASMLRGAGCELVEAVDGRCLLELLAKASFSETAIACRFDVIVADIEMPRLTGLELLASLRGAARNTPVILMTAHVTPPMRRRAMTLGAVVVLSKPLDLAELQRVLVAELAAALLLPRGDNAPHPEPVRDDVQACFGCGETRDVHPYGASAFCGDCVAADPFFRVADYCDLGGEG